MTRKRKILVNLLKVLPILLLLAYHIMGYTEKGIDISHHNIRFSTQDWTYLREQGYSFCYIKATEGSHFQDDTYKRVGKAARDAGFELGYYHFFRDNVSAEKQFANLVGHIDTHLTTLPIVLDYEKDGFVGKESEKVKKQRLRALSILVEKYQGRKPIIYCNLIEAAKLLPSFHDHQFWISDNVPLGICISSKRHSKVARWMSIGEKGQCSVGSNQANDDRKTSGLLLCPTLVQ